MSNILERLANYRNSLINFLGSRLSFFLVFTLFFIIFFAVYFSVGTVSSSDDHYFHIRFAQTLINGGFLDSFKNFKSIYFSRIAQGNQYFVYYNFLFYVFLLPFTFINPLFLGIKLYAVFAAAIAFALLYWCFVKFDIKNPFLWTLIIFGVTGVASIWRFFLARPYSLAPSLLLLFLYFIYRKNRIGVFSLSFVYLIWHSATFYMPILIAITYFVIEYFYHKKADKGNLAFTFLGTSTAIGATYLVSSGFFLYIRDVVFNTYWETILRKNIPIAEGSELYPLDFFDFIRGNAIMFAALIAAFSADISSYFAYRFRDFDAGKYFSELSQDRRILQTCVLILSAILLLGTVTASARFGDYFTFFAAIYVVLAFDYIRRSVDISGNIIIKQSLIISLFIVLIYFIGINLLSLQRQLAFGSRPNEFYETGTWLSKNTKPGDVIFNANWSWFPQLYYYSPKNYYVAGLEPRFMYEYDHALYWKWAHISFDGYVCAEVSCPNLESEKLAALRQQKLTAAFAKSEGDNIAESIKKDFQSEYIVTSKDQLLLNYIFSNNNHYKQMLFDSQYGYFIYKII